MQMSIVPCLVAFFCVSVPVLWASGCENEGPDQNEDVHPLKCPAVLPEAIPKEFGLLVQIVDKINAQITAGEIAAIQDTLQQHGLWRRGNVMEVTVGFSSLGGICDVLVDLQPHPAPGEQRKRLWIGRASATGKIRKVGEIRGFSQYNVLWDGGAEADVRDGSIVSYRESYMDFDEKSEKLVAFGHVGLQVEWSPEGRIIREEYLKTRRPFRLNLGVDKASDSP